MRLIQNLRVDATAALTPRKGPSKSRSLICGKMQCLCEVGVIDACQVLIIREAEVLASGSQPSEGFSEIAQVCRCAWGTGQKSGEK